LVDKISGVLKESDSEHGDALVKTGFWGKQGAGCIFMAKTTGRLLLPLRSAMVLQPETWGVWGGAIDSGENPSQAVSREASEEVGFRGIIEKLIPLYVYKDQKSGFQYHNFLAVVDDEFDPKLNWETDKYKWVEYGRWPSPLHFGLKSLIQHSGNEIKRIVDASNKGEGF
jgi:8-oxo-dGTP pyrophosphatase MutT (NUDIX family)